MPTRPLAALALLALSGCGGLASVDLDVPRFCLVERGVRVPGDPGAGAARAALSVDLGAAVPFLDQPGAALRVDEVRLDPAAGAWLGGITAAAVQADPPAGAPFEVVRYARTEANPAALVLTGPGVDVAPALSGGRLALGIELSGQPPGSAWSADVTVCATAALHAGG